jgi:hypothetical protein
VRGYFVIIFSFFVQVIREVMSLHLIWYVEMKKTTTKKKKNKKEKQLLCHHFVDIFSNHYRYYSFFKVHNVEKKKVTVKKEKQPVVKIPKPRRLMPCKIEGR